jgi:4,5-dihydroxyphthalate decarboxylase
MKMPATLRTALGNLDRTLPLIDGTVKVDGCDLAIEVLSAEVIIARALSSADFDLCELSFSNSITEVSKGDFPYLLIPVFLSRAFRHSSIFVRTDRGISKPQDLRGKVVGLQEYAMTAAVLIRGFLRDDYGLDSADIRWRVGAAASIKPSEFPFGRPPAGIDIQSLPARSKPEDRLLSGELDAAILMRRPASVGTANSKVAPLFQNAKSAEICWFTATKVFPIMHVLAIRKSLLKDDPGLGRRVFDAFSQAKSIAISKLEAAQVTLPWPQAAIQEARELMGPDYWPYGIKANRHALDAQIRWSRLDGLQARPVTIEEIFAADCLDT